ncbi:hypothetical protein L9F63_018873, partial [Diploptera punctata]
LLILLTILIVVLGFSKWEPVLSSMPIEETITKEKCLMTKKWKFVKLVAMTATCVYWDIVASIIAYFQPCKFAPSFLIHP